MKLRILPCFATLLAGAVAAPHAHAGTYAAMDEVPVEGGELRLSAPIRVPPAPGLGAGPDAQVFQFPLKHTRVTIDVAGVMAQYTVEQEFENPFGDPIEAVYVFPMGDDAAVSSYEIAIGERRIRGEIKTRQDARRIYDEARQSGHTAGLLEQDKPNVFVQRVANIAPGEAVRVRFTYVELLEQRDDLYELAFPMVVGPRFLPGGTAERRPIGAHDATQPAPAGITSVPYLAPGTRPGNDIEITARIDPGVPVAQFSSPSHEIAVAALGDTTTRVTLAQRAVIPNKDFVLRYRAAGERTTVGLITHRTDRDGYFALVVQPKADYRTGDIAPREVILLLDTSGSMDGQPLRDAQHVAKAILSSLTDHDVFNIMAFSDTVLEMRPAPIRGDVAGVAAGMRWVDALGASGGTMMERGMLRSLATRPGADRIRMVYLLSDGFVGNDDTILGAARKHLSHNRMFPVGIGTAPNRYLLDRLGEIGRGFTTYVASPGEAQEVAEALVRRSAYPYLTNVAIDWGGLRVADTSPSIIPDVYAGLPLVLSGRYQQPGKATVTIEATAAGRRVRIPLEVELPAFGRREGARFLWARRRIHELMTRSPGAIDGETRQAVTRLGLEFGLVTEFTSFVAVDRTRVVDGAGRARTVVQPAPLPEGVTFGLGGSEAAPAERDAGSPAPPAPPGGSVSGYRTPPPAAGRSVDRVGGGRVGGDVDPLTWLIALCMLPAAWLIRRTRRA